MSTHEPPCTPQEEDETFNIDIDSNIGWEPLEAKKYRKLAEQYRRSDKTIWDWNSMLESRPAKDWRRDDLGKPVKKREAADLFGTLWREGELAVLAGGTGVGKSILAVQIAESIARGTRVEPFRPTVPQIRNPRSAIRNREILYFDLEHTADQFWQRYTVTDGRRSLKYDFSSRNIRVGVRTEIDPPEAFRGNLTEYLFHSIEAKIRHSGIPLVIIDSLAHLAPTANRLTAVIRTLRLWCAQSNLSILVVANCREKVRSRRSEVSNSSLTDIHSSLSAYADSVFTLAPSTMREDVRYIKQLKSTSTPITLDDRSVATFNLTRIPPVGTRAPLPASTSATEPTEITELRSPTALISSPSSLVTCHSSLTAVSPFLGFHFVGFAPEQQHLIDYAAEAHRIETAEHTRLKRLGTGSVVDMVLSPEYQRYLKGE